MPKLGLRNTSLAAVYASGPSTLLNGLLYYWNFDTITNSSWFAPTVGSPYFYSNNAAVTGGLLGNSFWSFNSVGQTKQAITTNNGSSTPLNISPLPFAGNPTPSAVTINLWVNIGGSAVNNSVIFGKRQNSSGNLGYSLRFSNTSLEFSDNQGSFQNNLENPNNVLYAAFSDYPSLKGYGWIMVTIYTTVSGEIGIILNADASLMPQDGGNTGLMNSFTLDNYTSPLVLCVQGIAGISNAIDIKVDELGIWNRTLTGDELKTLYNNGLGKTYPF